MSVTRIRTNIAMMSTTLNLEIFNIYWFETYARDVLFSHQDLAENNADIIEMSLCKIDLAWIQKLWCWLDNTQHVMEVARVVRLLWLIPLEGRQQPL